MSTQPFQLGRKLSTGIATAVVAAAGLFTASAQATTLTYQGMANGYEYTTTTNTNPASSDTYRTGQMQFEENNNGVLSTLLSFCVDIFQSTSYSPQTYTLVSGITHFGATKADDLGRLFSEYDIWNTDNSMSAQESAALQLAVWEIATETSTHNGALSYDLSAGNFTATAENQDTLALAQSWLNGLPGVNNVYQVSVWESPNYQDQLVLNKVPEPGSMALVLGALGAMGVVAKRRKNAAKA